MIENKIHQFKELLGQTNPFPFAIHVEHAQGSWIWDKTGKKYLDLISGVAVTNIGHRHPKVVEAIKNQLDKYMHVMVYGEYIQDSSLSFAQKLTDLLPENLNMVYPVNSGTEANEAALKLAKRITGRSELIAFKGSYHGNTHGSMSVSYNEIKKAPFRPLLPDIRFLEINHLEQLDQITTRTAGVIIEPVQGDAGVRKCTDEFLFALRERCTATGAKLIFDEIQCGMGRTAKNFAFQHSNVVPDFLTLGKALGGGLPIGALVAQKEDLMEFTHSPMLGHITTFGGNPVVSAAAAATLEVLATEISMDDVERKGALLESYLVQLKGVKEIRRVGFQFACDMENESVVAEMVEKCLAHGLITFWFLSHPYSFRLSPPLTISDEEIIWAGEQLIQISQTIN